MNLFRPRLQAIPRLAIPRPQCGRGFCQSGRRFQSDGPTDPEEHPILQKYRKMAAERQSVDLQSQSLPAGRKGSNLLQAQKDRREEARAQMKRFGDLADNSIFKHPAVLSGETGSDPLMDRQSRLAVPSSFENVDMDALATVLDPQPRNRQMWERRQAISIIRRRGRLSKSSRLERTERSMMLNSPLWDTSIKKMMLLARQISGKSIEDAIVQMHFSKKVKNASRIKEFLIFARDKAVASMGMGLGLGNPQLGGHAGFDALYPPANPAEIESKMADFQPAPAGPVVVMDKQGKKTKIADPKGMYLARVWVVRGPYRSEVHFRSRHRASLIQHPSARLFVILKEQVTRIRESAERQARKDKRKVWVQLPDRPISAQNQHIMW